MKRPWLPPEVANLVKSRSAWPTHTTPHMLRHLCMVHLAQLLLDFERELLAVGTLGGVRVRLGFGLGFGLGLGLGRGLWLG